MYKIAISVSTGLILGSCFSEKKTEEAVKPVSTMVVGETRSYESRTLSGVVRPADTTNLSFEVAGKVEKVAFDLGESFNQGEVLATLDKIDYELLVQERGGQLSDRKARLQEVTRDYRRKRDLVKDGAVSRSAFDMAQSKYNSAKDQVQIAEARLAMAEENLADTELKAPYKGTIAVRAIEPSQRVSPNMTVFTIQGDTGLEVAALVSESLLASIEVGQGAKVEIPALGEFFDAQIKEVGTAAADASSFPVVLSLSSVENHKLKPGMSAEVNFRLNQKAAENAGFTSPVQAFLAAEEDGHYIFKLTQTVAQQDDTVEKDSSSQSQTGSDRSYIVTKESVKIIQLYDQYAVVQGDLKAGEIIVDAGLAFLKDGQRVSPIDKGISRYNH